MKIKHLLFAIGIFCISNFNSNAQGAASWIWAKGAGGSNVNASANSVGIDAGNNAYVTGSISSNGIIFNADTLTNNGLFLVKYDTLGNMIWGKGAGVKSIDNASSVCVDASNNVYITGDFGNFNITFGSTTLSNTGIRNIFLAKYNSAGNVIWAKSAGGLNFDAASSVCTDAASNVYIAGYFSSSSITFGATTLTNSGSNDNMFLAKYDSSGNALWATSAGESSGSASVSSICTDASGNVYVTGSFQSATIIFGTTTLTNNGSQNIFLVKYDALGNVVWATNAGGNSIDRSMSINVDASGNLYETGYIESSSAFFGSNTLTNNGIENIFLAKYDSSGHVIWAKSAGGNSVDEANSVSADALGHVYVAGYLQSDTIIFGTDTLTNNSSGNIFLVKYDSSGHVMWAKNAGGSSNDNATAVSIFSDNLYVAGHFDSPDIVFGSDTLTNSGTQNIFLAKSALSPPPNKPGNIIGDTTLCAGTVNTYRVTPVAGATSYTWALPTGWTGASTTDSIIATANASGGNISVSANNAFGSSPARILVVNVLLPKTSTVNANVCEGSTYNGHVINKDTAFVTHYIAKNTCDSAVTYNITLKPAIPSVGFTYTHTGLTYHFSDTSHRAASWHWNFGDGDTSTKQNPAHTYAISGSFLVCEKTTNSCGSDSICKMTTISTGIAFHSDVAGLKIYPNPTNNSVNITFTENPNGILTISNLFGQCLKTVKTNTQQTQIDLSDLAPAIYIISLENNSGKQVLGRVAKIE